jgi:hypothetical protein
MIKNTARWMPVVNADPPEAIFSSTVKPDGTFIAAQSSVENGTGTLYQVTTGKELYLCRYDGLVSCTVYGTAWVGVADDSLVLQYYLSLRAGFANQAHPLDVTLVPPIVIPADWYVRIQSSIAGIVISVCLTGWEYAV